MVDMPAIPFGDVRRTALDVLHRGCFLAQDEATTAAPTPTPCSWHERTSTEGHVGIYCNLVSHLDALRDLLAYGTWCDDYLVPEGWVEPDDGVAEQIISYLTPAFLVWEPLAEDYRYLLAIALGKEPDAANVNELRGWINQVLKHRHKGNVHHRIHHHGPYLFEDHPNNEECERDSEPTVARNGSLQDPGGRGWARVVVPSLISAAEALADMTAALDESLRTDGAAVARVEAACGITTPPWLKPA